MGIYQIATVDWFSRGLRRSDCRKNQFLPKIG